MSLTLQQWHLVSTYVRSKGGAGRPCEDFIVQGSRFIGLIDSSSGFAQISGIGESIGVLIGNLVKEVFETAGLDDSVDSLIREATSRVARLKTKLGFSNKHSGGCFFCLLDLSSNRIFRLGDCWFLIDTLVHRKTLAVEEPLTELRSAYLLARILAGETPAELAAAQPESAMVSEYLKVKDHFANSWGTERGYGVINGDEVPNKFVEVFDIPNGASVVAIGTDGYPIPAATLKQVEEQLYNVLRDDPLLIGNSRAPKGMAPGNDSFDDRAFIRLQRHALP
jgi:hypothetical protein